MKKISGNEKKNYRPKNKRSSKVHTDDTPCFFLSGSSSRHTENRTQQPDLCCVEIRLAIFGAYNFQYNRSSTPIKSIIGVIYIKLLTELVVVLDFLGPTIYIYILRVLKSFFLGAV